MTLPNFLIIGAPKCGTTSLYNYLIQHPDIYMSAVKEPRYFALLRDGVSPPDRKQLSDGAVWKLEDYRSLFDGVTTETAIGEASPGYLHSDEALHAIYSLIPDAKLLVILRDPSSRAFSGFLQNKRQGRECSKDLLHVLNEHKESTEHGDVSWCRQVQYLDRSFYYERLKRYSDRFGKGNLKIYFQQDLMRDPVLVCQDIFNYLGVDNTFVPDTKTEYNKAYMPKYPGIHALTNRRNSIKTFCKLFMPKILRKTISKRLALVNQESAPVLSAELRKELIQIFREDINRVESFVDRDLSQWLKP